MTTRGRSSQAVCAELGVGWTEVDITQDDRLFTEYGEQIPVTFVDGKQHDFWRVDPAGSGRPSPVSALGHAVAFADFVLAFTSS